MGYSFDFAIETGDKNKGTVYLPSEQANHLPVIIYCHGWEGDRHLNPSTKALCDMALSMNMAFVTFDFYGCGETGGDYCQMTYTKWKDNLSDIIIWLQNQSWVNKDKIGCFAISSGTTAAFRLAQEDHKLSFIISIATCISTNIGMSNGGPGKQLVDHLEALLAGKAVKLFGIDFGLNFYLDTVGKAPIYKMQEIKCPVYFLQGGADNLYRRSDANLGYQLMKECNLPAYHDEIHNGDHCLDNVAQLCAKRSIDWLNEIGIISY